MPKHASGNRGEIDGFASEQWALRWPMTSILGTEEHLGCGVTVRVPHRLFRCCSSLLSILGVVVVVMRLGLSL